MIEEYLTTPAAVWTMFIVLATVAGALVDGVGRLVWRFRDMGRTWVLTVPTVPGTKGSLVRMKLSRDEFTRKHPGGDEYEAFIRASSASFPTNKGPVLAMTDYGANLVAPTKDEAIAAGETVTMREAHENAIAALKKDADGVTQLEPAEKASLLSMFNRYIRFRVADPLIYWRAAKENDLEDMYAAQREKEHWAVKLAPVVIILFVGILAFLGFMLWKVMPLLEKAGN